MCATQKNMCKSDSFGVDFVNGKGLVFKYVGLCSKFDAKKDDEADPSNLRNTTEEKEKPEC